MASNNVYQKFLKSGISLSPFGILDVGTIDFYPYFCTPKGAKIIGRTGSDGVHYCFVRGFKLGAGFALDVFGIDGTFLNGLLKDAEE